MRHKGRQEKAQGQPRIGTRAAKKRHKGSQEKAQGKAKKGTKAPKKRQKGRQEKAQGLVATLAGYCVHSTLVPAIVPIFFFAPTEEID